MDKSKFAAAPGQKCCPRNIDILLFGTRQCQTPDGWFNARPDFLGLSLLRRGQEAAFDRIRGSNLGGTPNHNLGRQIQSII